MGNEVRKKTFRKVLVANRGEIARRIFRTLREMGIPSVAVFSDADQDAPHVAEADEAVRLGPAPSGESYLHQERVLAAARATGADAVHPGYGFLSENAIFAARCADADLTFIGPTPDAIRRMGDKAEAKALAREVGVPVLDGFSVAGLSAETVAARAAEVGFPLLVKATAGGGGKGMRAVRSPEELSSALVSAAREAESAFGDGSLLVERLVESPRHVEIQILADQHGRVLSCFERDCSVQRRHQKVFEEAPSPAVGPELRRQLGDAAVALARAVEYRGAGTVELLLDRDGDFYFLEMNTRLQVEHPVTEMVTGLDLVEQQIQIAQGWPLRPEPDDLEIDGHAIEARLYAEDPANDFLPAAGIVALWSPPELPGLRIDSGIEAGSEIGVDYDPMLAKVIAHGRDRDEALRRLHRGLSELAVGGLVTNRDFLLAVLEHEIFRDGRADTGFLSRHLPGADRSRVLSPESLRILALAATASLVVRRRERPGPVPAGIPKGWRNHPWRDQEQAFESQAGRLTVAYRTSGRDQPSSRRFSMTVALPSDDHPAAENEVHVRSFGAGAEALLLEIDGIRRRFRLGFEGDGPEPDRVIVHGLGRVVAFERVPRFPRTDTNAVAGANTAPMTGKVVEVLVAEGDLVRPGQPLLVLEAMKMEHQLQAQHGGVVRTVRARVGQMVDPDEILVIVDPEEETST